VQGDYIGTDQNVDVPIDDNMSRRLGDAAAKLKR
jgi:hypothetical protein